jgi:hypothetical protein
LSQSEELRGSREAGHQRLCVHRHSSVFSSRTFSIKKALLGRGLWKHNLCRRFYQIASVRTVTKTCAEKRRAILIDLAIGLGILLLQIPLRASPFSSSPILKLVYTL